MQEVPHYIAAIKEVLDKRSEKNPRYSLRAFAQFLGFEPTVVSQILSGKRVPSIKTAEKLINTLSLNPEQQRLFLESLALTHHRRKLKKMSVYFKNFGTEGNTQPKELSLELFRVISDWYHYAILALTQVENFKSSTKWIASQLNISEVQASLAIDRLNKLELLEIGADKKLKSREQAFTTADKKITSPALKVHQTQVLGKAIESLEKDSIENRSMSSMTMAIDPQKIPAAKKKIENFTQELSQFLESGTKTQVYELSIALFPLQKKEIHL